MTTNRITANQAKVIAIFFAHYHSHALASIPGAPASVRRMEGVLVTMFPEGILPTSEEMDSIRRQALTILDSLEQDRHAMNNRVRAILSD